MSDKELMKMEEDNPAWLELRNSKGAAIGDDDLGKVMLSTKATKEQKDAALAQYLFERGLESASYLAELFQSKGQHTKETRLFKRQVRYDFELFVGSFIQFLRDTSKGIVKTMHSEEQWEEKKKQILQDRENDVHVEGGPEIVFNELAMRFEDEADRLAELVSRTTEERMREKGYGIYVNKHGEIYSIFDEDIVRVVKKDKEEIHGEQTENNKTGKDKQSQPEGG